MWAATAASSVPSRTGKLPHRERPKGLFPLSAETVLQQIRQCDLRPKPKLHRKTKRSRNTAISAIRRTLTASYGHFRSYGTHRNQASVAVRVSAVITAIITAVMMFERHYGRSLAKMLSLSKTVDRFEKKLGEL